MDKKRDLEVHTSNHSSHHLCYLDSTGYNELYVDDRLGTTELIAEKPNAKGVPTWIHIAV